MNENIDLTKILKNCPKGFKLYSSIYGIVTFWGISIDSAYEIIFSCYGHGTYNAVTKRGISNKKYAGECTLFPSKDQRDWSKFTAPWYKKEKFDPNTLKPFDKVLIFTSGEWTCDFFSHMLSGDIGDIFDKRCMGIGDVNVVIPYNDETKHLVGTKEEAPEFYRYWED